MCFELLLFVCNLMIRVQRSVNEVSELIVGNYLCSRFTVAGQLCVIQQKDFVDELIGCLEK